MATLYLRTKDNKTIVDIELNISRNHIGNGLIDIHSVVSISEYSNLLLKNLDRKQEIVDDFSDISKLRGWLWETYFAFREHTKEEYLNVRGHVKDLLKIVAMKYDLCVVED